MSLNRFKILGDQRGSLIAIESNKDIPFEIKRVFYIFGTQPETPRGNHAHYKTKQYLISVSGSCKVTLDNGDIAQTYELDSPEKGLFQDALTWGTMHDFSKDCVLLVFANENYDPLDYIHDYQVFLEAVKNA